MVNKLEIQGRVSGFVSSCPETDGIRCDMILASEGSRFQVMGDPTILLPYSDGDRITVFGRLVENGGDCYILADSIEPDKQKEFNFG